MSIASLGYLGFKVSDIDAWTAFASGVLGLMAAPAPEGERRFRADEQAWRLSIRAGDDDDLDYIGLEVADAAALAAVADRLRAAGVGVSDNDTDLAEARGVSGLIVCRDPQGLEVEIYYGATARYEVPFASPAGVGGFVTGDQGIGHVVLAAADIGAARRFYADLLGFRLSDIIRMRVSPTMAIDLEFYRCNPRHHTLALVPAPARKRLHHFMLQAQQLDDVGFALERAQGAGAAITASLGRHTNDHMLSFYARTPSGFEVEFGHGARTVDEAAWRVARHDKTSLWGHHPPAAR